MALGRTCVVAGLAAALLLVSVGCGTQDEAAEIGEGVAALLASGDCIRLLDVTASVQRALSGVVGTDLASVSAFLSGLAPRAPAHVAGDLRTLSTATAVLAGGAGADARVDATSVRAAAERVAAWARQRCPA